MLSLYPAPADGAITPQTLAAAVWIDLLEPTAEETAMVVAVVGIDPPSREAVSEIENSSRLQLNGDVLRLSAPLLAHADTSFQTLTPVGFVLTPRVLVTVRFSKLRVFEGVAAQVEARPDTTSAGVFVLLLEAIVDRDADLLERAAGELEALSRALFYGDTSERSHIARNADRLRQALAQVGQLGDRLSELRATLLGVGRIVPFASEVAVVCIGTEHHARLKAVRQDIASLDDFEAHLSNKTQFLLDAVLGFINTQQNDLFKVLTIVSVVGVPPTLVASVYGMNFHVMPELSWPWGYPFALVLILASALLPMVWFKWKRWW